MSLIKRTEDKLTLWELIASTGGELTPVLEAWLDEVEKNLQTKVDQYKFFQDELKSEIQRLKAEATELSTAARSLERVEDALKSRIKDAMIKLGVTEMRGQSYRFKLSDSAPSLIIDDETRIPGAMTLVKIEPDKALIKSELLAGTVVPGARLQASHQLRTYVNKGAV